ncbi:MAG: redoxin domain-containing protein [Parabacteroides sp.]
MKYLWFIGWILCLTACGRGTNYQVEGKLSNLEDQTIYAVFEQDNRKVVDTIECDKPGHFKLERINDADYHCVTLFFEGKSRWVTAYLEPGQKVTISGDAQYPLLLQIKGGTINDQLTEARKEIKTLLKEVTDLSDQLNSRKGGANTMEAEAELTSRIANINLQLSEFALNYVKEHPDRKASVVLMQLFFLDPDDTRKLDELLVLLTPEVKDFYLTKELEQYSIRAKRTALGAEAPGFTVRNIYGKTVKLESYAHKYLLLAFTAPWCDMCQTEDLLLDQIATQYPTDKVEILLISLDDKPKELRQMLSQDSIAWNVVTDSAGQATQLIDLYNVNALPRCFLIDEEGILVLKTDNGIELKQTLETLID